MKKETYTPEEIQKKFDALPADIKSIVYSADMLGVIKKTGEKYKLHIDQLDVLEAETADVMTGFSKPDDFVANLSASLSVDRVQAENIAKDINDGLFIKIRESLKRLYGENKTPVTQATTPAPAKVVVSTPAFKAPPAAPAAPPKGMPGTTKALEPLNPKPPTSGAHPADTML